VLFSGNWERFRPKVVVAEAVAPMTSEPSWRDWESFLISHRYRFVLFDTLNRFYVAEEYPEIIDRFPTERAPWHAVRHMYEIGRAPENEQHPDHALARELARGFWASLPYLDANLIMSILGRGRQIEEKDDLKVLASVVGAKNSARPSDASPAVMTADRSSRIDAASAMPCAKGNLAGDGETKAPDGLEAGTEIELRISTIPDARSF